VLGCAGSAREDVGEDAKTTIFSTLFQLQIFTTPTYAPTDRVRDKVLHALPAWE
jgi:hypothetical protein